MKKLFCCLLALSMMLPYAAFAVDYTVGVFAFTLPDTFVVDSGMIEGEEGHSMQNFDDNAGAEHAWAHYTIAQEGEDAEQLYTDACDAYLSNPESGIARGFTTYVNENGIDVRWGKLKSGGYRLLAKGENAFVRFEIDSETQLEEMLDGMIASIRTMTEEEIAALSQPVDIKRINLANLSLEELISLQNRINNRISQLRKIELTDTNKIEVSGNGTTVKSGIDVAFSPARIILEADASTSVVLSGGKWDYSTNGKYRQRFIDDTASYDALVESKGNWALTIEPIEYGGSMTISGVGPYVGDFFTFSTPTIVSIEADCSGLSEDVWWSNFIVSLCHQYSNLSSWQSESLTNELLSPGDTFSTEAAVKPTKGRTDYFWQIECEPGVEWKITVK